MEQGVKIYTFTYYTDEHSHSVEILLQIIIFVLTNMGDTYMYKAKGLIDSSMTYQIKLEIMVNLQIDYDTDWLKGAPFVNGSVNNFSTDFSSLLGICQAFIILFSERCKCPMVGEADLYM